jgi:hypothetical protein
VDAKSVPMLPGKKEPIYTRITFTVQADATMASIVRMMEQFYKTPLLHQIKNLTLQRQLTATTTQARTNELRVQMTIEALVVTGADNRTWLLPNIDRRLLAVDLAAALRHGPNFLGLALWHAGPTGPPHQGDLLADPPRNYEAIAQKNIFLGRPPPPAVTRDDGIPEWLAPRWVYMTDITRNDRRTESFLFDRSTNRRFRLRATEGFNTFPFVRDGEGRTVVRGAVVKIDDRDIIYRVDIAGEEAQNNRSSERNGFFRPGSKERESLLAEKLISAGEEKRVFRVTQEYWESLERLQIVRTSREAGSFRMEIAASGEAPGDDFGGSYELLRGTVVRRDGPEVLIKVEEKFFSLHVGQNIEESLRKALPESQVKELKLAGGG